ncbi:succinoglycan biosynthesis transport protein ExoP [Ereboglobus sp. PH5-10]|uniref:GumC family protein n=1 Tax=Ereboglobus sp. PH5-10 TaxID=2940629 RepID=UPI0024060027|nr:polysaccharide biosynthesis tyrosine autokinase [Ereboglobus sp. PH5-10]MDF9826649.1 succinoglycan biosynthesis transport protein ExoP [Ereboglobus sp. PH5-10]
MAYSDPVKESAPLPAFLQTLNLRKALILLILALVVITTIAVTAFLPKWYRSKASIRVLKIGATSAVFQAQSNDYYDPYFVQDQLRTIKSPKIINPVIERLKLNEKLAAVLEIPGPLPVDFTYDYLIKKRLVSVESPKTSSIVEITIDSRDPALSAAIANEIVGVYTEDRINLATAAQKADLAELNNQLAAQEKIVIAQRDTVERLRAELSISGIDLTNPRNNSMEVERLRQMQSTLVALTVDANSLKTRYESFRDIPPDKRLSLVNAQLIEDPGTQRLQQIYLEAEQNVTKLSARLGEAHPEMIVASENLSKIKTQLEAQLTGYEFTLKSKAEEAEARVAELKKQLEEAKTSQIENASKRMRPFEEAMQKLDEATRLYTTFKLTLRQREIDYNQPKRPVEILSKAEPKPEPERPSWPINITFAILFGVVLGIGTALLIDMFDASFRSVADVERRLQRPVLGVIPSSLTARKPAEEPLDPAEDEPFRVLQTNITLALRNKPSHGAQTLVMLSAGPGEGKSTTLLRLARAMGAAGERVLLIDADLRRPTQHRLFNVAKTPGLADLLQSKVTLDQCRSRNIAPGLDFIPSGTISGFTLSLFYADRLKEILADLRTQYDRIVFDAPPIIGVSDSAVITSLIDHVLLLIQYRRNPLSMVLRAQQTILGLDKEILGVVLNRVPKNAGADYAYYSKNYAYYGSKSARSRDKTAGDTINFSEKK